MLKKFVSRAGVLSAVAVSVPAVAHDGSEQASVMSGIIHFMTEPDHLLVSAVVAAGLIYTIRKLAAKRG
ncbi:HupE/UreJ family protein [Neptuniibacter halophilus]|uniref:HupE/UreJ family protein n=1 Tax=Neptuniibacter halophilus TaxID=651666 RepID=UPI002572A367|nr:HupE/UreJ family protein [Neptuniibacter halophilus]